MKQNSGILILGAIIVIALLLSTGLIPLEILGEEIIDSINNTRKDYEYCFYGIAQKFEIPIGVTEIGYVRFISVRLESRTNTDENIDICVGISTVLDMDDSLWITYADVDDFNGGVLLVDLNTPVIAGETYYIIITIPDNNINELYDNYMRFETCDSSAIAGGNAWSRYYGVNHWRESGTEDYDLDLKMGLYEPAEELTVTCYKCSGNSVLQTKFPTGTVCGTGVASGYQSTPPDCGDDDDDDDTNGTSTPGFELVLPIIAIAMLLIYRKRRN